MDFVWAEFFQDDFLQVNIEIEEELNLNETFSEYLSIDSDFKSQQVLGVQSNDFNLLKNICTGFFKHGNSFFPLNKQNGVKLFIFYCQLRFHY